MVTGRRQALQDAVERKRNSDVIVDSVVAEDAGALPDTSVTEVLARVSGVTAARFNAANDLDHFSVEGSGIQVRGLSGVAGRLNGREVFSATGGRGLSWGDVTPELLAAVDVYKSSSADLIEGGTGGQVDLRTRMPFDFDGASLGLSFDANYANLRDAWTPSASILLSNRFDTPIGEIGILADVAYSEHSARSDFFRMERYRPTRVGTEDYLIPGGFTYGRDELDYTRTGYYLAAQWRPSDELEIYGTGFVARYDNTMRENGQFITNGNLAFDPAVGEHEFDSNNGLLRSTRLFTRNNATFAPASGGNIFAGGNTGIRNNVTTTSDVAVGFNWTPNDSWAIRGALQSVFSKADAIGFNIFPEVQVPGFLSIDLTGDLPRAEVIGGDASIADLSNNIWAASMENYSERQGHLYAANLDFEYTFSDSGFLRELQFGVRHADRTERDRDGGFNWTALGRGWSPTCPDPLPANAVAGGCGPQLNFTHARPGDIEPRVFDNFFHGDLPLAHTFLMPSNRLAETYDKVGLHRFYGGDPRTTTNGQVVNPYEYVAADFLRSSTINTAAYALIRVGLDDVPLPFDANIGVRYVEIENTSTGFYSQGNNTFVRDGTTYTLAGFAAPVTGGRSYSEVLPNLNVTFRPTDEVQLRFAVNRTLDQPGFNEIRAQGSLGVATQSPPIGSPPGTPNSFVNFTSTTGNPQLLPVLSDNIDISLEWYPRDGTFFNIALFHKNLQNFYINGANEFQLPVFYSNPPGLVREETVIATNTFNSPVDATIQGFEVGGQVFFDFLPGFWSGFGVTANYTFIDSENPGDFYRDALAGTVCQGTSPAPSCTTLPIILLSENNFNAQLIYEEGPFSARLAYTWRDEYLSSTDSNGTRGNTTYCSAPGVCTTFATALPIYPDAYGQLDGGLRYTVNERLQLSIDARNLTNEVQRTLMGGYGGDQKYVRSWFVSDQRVTLGLRYTY